MDLPRFCGHLKEPGHPSAPGSETPRPRCGDVGGALERRVQADLGGQAQEAHDLVQPVEQLEHVLVVASAGQRLLESALNLLSPLL